MEKRNWEERNFEVSEVAVGGDTCRALKGGWLAF